MSPVELLSFIANMVQDLYPHNVEGKSRFTSDRVVEDAEFEDIKDTEDRL